MEAATAPVLYSPTQDERTIATLAHALQLVGGFIAPLVIFLIRRESKFVSFHALQVLLFHALIFVLGIPVMVLFFSIWLGTIGAFVTAAAHTSAPTMPQFPFALFAVFPIFWMLWVAVWITELVFAILYAIRAGRGEWAKYPLLGDWARRILKL